MTEGVFWHNIASMAKRIAILGSTGSIGTSALKVIDSLNSQADQQYEIIALSANSKYELLAEQVKKYQPKFAVITDSSYEKQLGELTKDLNVEVFSGAEALVKIAGLEDVDIVLAAIVACISNFRPFKSKRNIDNVGN